jgi:hypothetical protein
VTFLDDLVLEPGAIYIMIAGTSISNACIASPIRNFPTNPEYIWRTASRPTSSEGTLPDCCSSGNARRRAFCRSVDGGHNTLSKRAAHRVDHADVLHLPSLSLRLPTFSPVPFHPLRDRLPRRCGHAATRTTKSGFGLWHLDAVQCRCSAAAACAQCSQVRELPNERRQFFAEFAVPVLGATLGEFKQLRGRSGHVLSLPRTSLIFDLTERALREAGLIQWTNVDSATGTLVANRFSRHDTSRRNQRPIRLAGC